MQIKGSKILVLGGWGLVGSALCRKLMEHKPAQLIVSSLRQAEAEDAVAQLRAEFPESDPKMFVPAWGNVFTRMEWKDNMWSDVLAGDESRKGIIQDIYNELDENILNSSALYTLINENKPDIVIDCINTATAIAYQDVYNTSNAVRLEIEDKELEKVAVERLMASLYIPQLIRHIQILYRGLVDGKTTTYLKIGTSGTGGMGLNIPYTHSEERPSRVLLAKSAVAGAQTLLLFLMARTPNGPLIKEIKPTAAIAWKRIAYDKVYRKGRPIPLVDMPPAAAHKVGDTFKFSDARGVVETGKDFESVFIDTGENGIFSRGEFQAISALGQMEIVTAEDIAEYAVFELLGGNTGYDVIQGLDGFTLGPTYRGGMMQQTAVKKIEKLEKEHGVDSIAFELLGPPRLSKLLYEAYILRKVCGSMKNAVAANPEAISKEAAALISSDEQLRSQMVSIGLVVLMPDGRSYLRGKDVKIPVNAGRDQLTLDKKSLEKWCFEGWVDLRPSSFIDWQKRIKRIIEQAEAIPDNETSSRYTYTKDYWDGFDSLDEGKIAGWIFEYEDKGWRFKR